MGWFNAEEIRRSALSLPECSFILTEEVGLELENESSDRRGARRFTLALHFRSS